MPTFTSPYIIFTASSPTSSAQINLGGLRNNSLTNQDAPIDPCCDNRLRNSCMSLDEKTRTMSRSGSFRDGFEEGRSRREKAGCGGLVNIRWLRVSPGHVFLRCLVKSVIRCNPFLRTACPPPSLCNCEASASLFHVLMPKELLFHLFREH